MSGSYLGVSNSSSATRDAMEALQGKQIKKKQIILKEFVMIWIFL